MATFLVITVLLITKVTEVTEVIEVNQETKYLLFIPPCFYNIDFKSPYQGLKIKTSGTTVIILLFKSIGM